MKKTIKKIFSLIIVFCMACVGLISTPIVGAKAEESGTWNLVTDASDLAVGDKVVVVAKDYDYALSTGQNKNNRGQAEVTKDGNTITFGADVQQITLEAGTVANTFAFNVGDGYLYAASSSSNYLRTETTLSNNSSWMITIADGTATIVAKGDNSRNVMQYNQTSSLFACYGSDSQKAICLYKFVAQEEIVLPEAIKDLNAVNAYMSLSYKYKETTQEVEASSEVTDTLNRATTGVTGTTYTDWSDKTATSSAVYAGQSAGGNSSIQLRSTNSNSGIITTASGGKATKITVTWYSGTASGRTLNVYGKNTAYSEATDLYSESTQGTKLGTIVYGTSTELVIDGDYEYIGVRSASGAMYLSEIQITWDTGSGGGTKTETVLTDSEFRFRCGVDASLLDLKDVVDAYGIRVTAKGNTADYTEAATSWATDAENGMVYVIIGLGDIIDDIDKLTTEFTVQAYVVYDEVTYLSASTKTYSVASIIKMYYEEKNIVDVEHLYNYLQENNQEVA